MITKLNKEFKEAVDNVSNLENSLPPDTLLRLYAYYKQATKGDNFSFNVKRDIRSAFKFNAWMQLKGMDAEQAKEEYVKLVNSILK